MKYFFSHQIYITRSNGFQWSLIYCLCNISGSCLYLFVCCSFFHTIRFCAFWLVLWLSLTALLQAFIDFTSVISSSSKENGFFFMVKCLAPIANQERIWSDLLIFVNFIHSLVRFSLVCSYSYVVSNMKWVARRICSPTRGMHDERKKKWCEMEDWDGVSLDAQTQCVSLLLVFFQLYLLFLTFYSYNWYSFLILFSLGLIPAWPLYSGWW